MDEARLSQRERRILAEIEQALSEEDVALERGLRTMRRKGLRVRAPRGRTRGGRASGDRAPGDRSPGDGAPGDRTPGRSRRRHVHALAVGVSLLGVLTVGLLVLAVATGEPALIWAFAAVWVLTLTGLLRLVIRWSRRLRPKSWPT